MSTEINESGLTDKQERFAHEYLVDHNASAACLRAGYSARSKGPQSAALMAMPAVRKRIRGLMEEMYGEIKLSAGKLVREQMAVAFFDPRKLISAGNRPKKLSEWGEDVAAVMLVNFDVRGDGEPLMKVRQPSRSAALNALERRLAQYMKLQEEDTITERENADMYRSLGYDPAEVAAGTVVVRFTPDRKDMARFFAERAAAEKGVGVEIEGAVAQGAGTQAAGTQGAAAQVVNTPAPVVDAPAPVLPKTAAPARPAPAQPVATPQPTTTKVCVPTARASKKGWSDAWGNIDVDHPHIPPEVKARELEKRRRKAEEEAGRNNPGLLLNYMDSTVGQPNPPWPRPLVRSSAQRFAISEDDPYGTGGGDWY